MKAFVLCFALLCAALSIDVTERDNDAGAHVNVKETREGVNETVLTSAQLEDIKRGVDGKFKDASELKFCGTPSNGFKICILCSSGEQRFHCSPTRTDNGAYNGSTGANYSLSTIQPCCGLQFQGSHTRFHLPDHWFKSRLDVSPLSMAVFPHHRRYLHRKAKLARAPCPYYSNSCATQRILLRGGDISMNPGPLSVRSTTSRGTVALPCSLCERTVRRNHKRLVCDVCRDLTHALCAASAAIYKSFHASEPRTWTCSKCTLSELPFFGQRQLLDTSDSSDCHVMLGEDQHLETLQNNERSLKIMHLNTQSMVSTFDSLRLTIERYSFDIITMSETWLKNNNLLLEHVTIPGYSHAFNHRDKARGGGVGVYIKDTIVHKRRTDIEKRYPAMEHLWLEISGRNKHSKLLLGIVYRSDRMMLFSDWLDNFESLLSDLTISWDGMLMVTGDVNVDLFSPTKPAVRKYKDILETLNLTQLVTKATRTTLHSISLIDHIITNMPGRVSHCDVLPCPLISDHDAPYACVNVRVTRFVPRYKFIRNERGLDEEAFVKDFERLPFSLVYSTDDPETQVDFLCSLFRACIDRHAPLRRTKVTRPPAPWMKQLDIRQLQSECSALRRQARHDKSDQIWSSYREKRNQLKFKINRTKREFYDKALSSNKPKEVWKTIHRILHPGCQPLRHDPDKLNRHFASTAQRVTGTPPVALENIQRLVEALPDNGPGSFELQPVSYHQVFQELRKLRSDCSCGPDSIPVKYIKLVADQLASPLTHILNNCISLNLFPSAWKTARISPIPKCSVPKDNNDLRPISILPVLSKIYERLVMCQMEKFISSGILKDTISAYRKGHSTTTALIAIKDDIVRAMKRGEVTMAILADFSKAFDTVAFEIVLKKLHKMGFSKSFLLWIMDYLTGRKQFVQIDDKVSTMVDVEFGVPQGSVLGPVLFNLYVNDLRDHLGPVECHQYADDTTFYVHSKPSDIRECEKRLQVALDRMSSWSKQCNLALNPTKTKTMLLSTSQLARVHHLDDHKPELAVDGRALERVTSTRLLGTEVHQYLKWDADINAKISSCYSTLSVLRKLKNLAPFHLRKQLAESLILSKIDYNITVEYPLHDYLVRRLQRVELAAAGFVIRRYASISDILKLGWLPILERQEYILAKLAFKALHFSHWPGHLKLQHYVPTRNLRSASQSKLINTYIPGTFQHNASKAFNNLPLNIRSCPDFNAFIRAVKNYFKAEASEKLQ